jgi:hypothetical protein
LKYFSTSNLLEVTLSYFELLYVTHNIFTVNRALACERPFEEKEEHRGFWKNFFGG